MASTLTLQVNDQNGNPLANIGIELHSYDSSSGTDERINSAILITASNGRVTFTSDDSKLADKYPLFYIQLYEGSQIIKSTNNYVTSNVINTVQTIVLYKTGTGNNIFKVYVVDELSQLPASGVDVRILSGGTSEIQLNTTTITTDSNGNADYTVTDQFFAERHPTVVVEFRVNQELRETSDPENTYRFFEKRIEYSFVTTSTGYVVNRVVRGIVVDADEAPLAGKTVKAYQVKAGTRDLIEETTTGTDGGYYILYSQILIAGAEPEFDLQVDVVDTDGVTVLIKSPVILNSNREETINLIVSSNPYVGVSTFAKIDSLLATATSDLDLGAVTEADILLLSRRLDVNSSEIRKWIAVKDLNDRTGLADEVIYALLSYAGESSFSHLLLQGKQNLSDIVKNAINKNVVKLAGDVETVAESAAATVIEYVADTLVADGSPRPDFRQLIDAAGIVPAKGKIFLTELLNHEGTEESLWEHFADMVSAAQITAGDLAKFKDITAFATLTGGSVDLTKRLLTDFSSSKNPLFVKTVNNWLDYFDDYELTAPEEFDGATAEEKLTSWATHITEALETYYPAAHLAQQIESDAQISIDYLSDFVALNPDFDFSVSSLTDNPADDYSYPTTTGFVKEQFIETLKAVKRVYVLLPNTGKTPYFKLIWNNNLHSSLSVAAMGKIQFASMAVAESLDEEVATAIYNNAERTTFGAFATYLHLSHDLKDADTLGLADTAGATSLLSEIFGSQDYCQCEHCQSVYGPAAYLMDLIDFCNTHNSAVGGDFMSLLNARRPDIKQLYLNCKNTNQEIPYLDIVNEVLEMKLSPGGDYQQTEGDAEDIEAYPQKLIPDVYDDLKTAVYPWEVPFHLWNEEADAYLEMVGVTREQIAWQVPVSFSSSVNYISDQELNAARCYLKMAPQLHQLLTGSPSAGSLYKAVSTSDFKITIVILFDGHTASLTGVRITELLQRTGLSYQELLDYMKSRYINPSSKVISFNMSQVGTSADYIESCKLEEAVLAFTDDELVKLYKFVQLHRLTGWTLYELDRVLTAFGITTVAGITDELVRHLYYIQKIHLEYDVDVTEMLTWWKTMNEGESYENVKSLYAATYGAKVNDAVITYATTSFSAAPVMNRMAAINELTVDEYDLLVDKILPATLLSGGIVSYQSVLYGVAYFTRIAGISVNELIDLADIMEKYPVSVYNGTSSVVAKTPKDSLQFLQELDTIRKSGFSIADFIYLMSAKRPSGSNFLLKEQDAVSWLTDLRAELKEIRKRYISPESEPDQNQWNSIAQIFEGEAGSIAQQVAATDNPTGLASLISASPYLFPDSADAINKLTTPAHADYLSSSFDRLSYMVSLSGSHLQADEDAVVLKQAASIVRERLTSLANSVLSVNDASDTTSRQAFQTAFSQILNVQQTTVQNLSESYQPTQSEIEEYLPELLTDQMLINQQGGGTSGQVVVEVVPETLLQALKRLLYLLVEEEDADQLYANIITVYSALLVQSDLENRRNLITQCLGDYLDAEDLCNRIIPNNSGDLLLSITARVLYTVEQLVNYLMRDALYQRLSNLSGIEYNMVKLLFEKYMNNYGSPFTRPAHYYFTYSRFVNSGSTILFNSIQSIFLEVFYKCSSYIKVNKLSTADVDYILGEVVKGSRTWLRFSHFPARSQAFFDKPDYQKWVKLQKSTRLHRNLFRPDYSVFGMYQLDGASTLFDYLEKATGWSDLETDGAGLATGASFSILTDDEWVTAVENVVTLTRKTKITYAQLKGIVVSVADIVADGARIIRFSAKASFTRPAWLEQAVPVRNNLRERQRNAMVAYICKNELVDSTITTPDQLFEYLFIDTQMASCGRISRIKEATLAVQTMINRSLLGLLSDLKFSQDNVDQWEWRRNYRVWEANRKVFLYPENYLLPELRSDKTPFYKEFEKKLKQSDLTDESIEQLYRDYLTGLADVANLEVCAFSGHHLQMKTPTFDVDTSPTDMHVIARSRTHPRKYYYRKWVDQTYWTPWEAMDVDIQGDHIGVVQWNNYIVVTWLEFTEKALNKLPDKIGITSTIDKTDGEPAKYQEIRLGWCVRSNGVWGKKQVSTEPLIWKKIKYSGSTVSYTDPYTTYIKDLYYVKDQGSIGLTTMSTDMFINDTISRWGNISVGVYYNLGLFMRYDQSGVEREYYLSATVGSFTLSSIFEKPKVTNGYGDYKVALNNSKLSNNLFNFYKSGDYSVFANIPAGLIKDISGNYLPLRQVSLFGSKQVDYQVLLPSGQNVAEFIGSSDTYGTLTAPGHYSQDPFFVKDNYGSYMFTCHFTDSPVESIGKSLFEILVKGLPSNSITDASAFLINEESAVGNYYSSAESNSIIDRTETTTRKLVASSSLPVTNSYEDISDGLPITGGSTTTQPVNPSVYAYFSAKLFYHPYADYFQRVVNRYGYKELLKPSSANQYLKRQGISSDSLFTTSTPFSSSARYFAKNNLGSYPKMEIEFLSTSAYGVYNYELFFHIPLTMAERLTAVGRYDEARNWLHYIFNPTNNEKGDATGAKRFWMFKPFYDLAKEAESPAGTTSGILNEYYGLVEFEEQIRNWEENPFDPHAVARLRIVAYMKYVFMKYLDNLIAWADSLYARDTWETIQESLQLYILAAGLLGRRPEQTRKHESDQITINAYLARGLDEFGNTLVRTSNFLIGNTTNNGGSNPTDKPLPGIVYITSLYFGIPQNDKLLTYWDVVADRLFKIRHCMNIEGVERQLALFDPPIDPMLLIRAKAAGLSIGAALNEINALLPAYRFQHLVQKALEFTGEVKGLGQSLLSALEKKDSEELGLLRNTHEARLFEVMREIKVAAINEAQAQLDAAQIAATSTLKRSEYYKQLLSAGLIDEEKANLWFTEQSREYSLSAVSISILGAMYAQIPNFNLGTHGPGGSPVVTAMFGGSNLSSLVGAVASMYSGKASSSGSLASLSGTMAGHKRRQQEWKLQSDLASIELKQSEKQILAATIRLEMAKHELNQLDTQINQNKEIEAYLEDKFTSSELYGWMMTRLSDVYLSAYKLALEMARKAERAYRFELGVSDTTFINTTYWDSLYKGLLAGESLTYDLHRMDAAFTDNNKRRFEMQKHISLAAIDPQKLFDLRAKGQCNISLNEMMFDLDYPGQYQRRIKSVSISIPAVTGPYTNVNCKLTLLKSSYRKNALLSNGVYEQSTTTDDPRFVSAVSAIQSIATSSGTKDSGMFEFNFNDSRYLPFEGAGVISNWLLELPADVRQFDYDTISDVIIHINYSALQDGVLKTKAADYLKANLTQLMGLGDEKNEFHRMISLKQERVDNLYQFLNPVSGSNSATTLAITYDDFPYFIHDKEIRISSVTLFVHKEAGLLSQNPVTINNSANQSIWAAVAGASDWSTASADMTGLSLDASDPEVALSISAAAGFPDVDDIIVILKYTIEQ